MHVERANHGFGLKVVPQRVVDLLVLLAVILLGILPCVPKAESQNLIALRVRDEHDLVDEAALFFRIGTAFSLMVLASSFDLPDLLVNSTTRVNIDALLSLVRG